MLNMIETNVDNFQLSSLNCYPSRSEQMKCQGMESYECESTLWVISLKLCLFHIMNKQPIPQVMRRSPSAQIFIASLAAPCQPFQYQDTWRGIFSVDPMVAFYSVPVPALGFPGFSQLSSQAGGANMEKSQVWQLKSAPDIEDFVECAEATNARLSDVLSR
jgi:hypothetical protein